MSAWLEDAESWVHSPQALLVGVCCAAVSIIISVTHIIYHLNNYTMPAIQIYVIRILVICPVYAVSSALALWLGQQGLYAETFRDIYEAFVIYSFLGLILEFSGGETDCIYQIENEPPLRMPCPLCCMEPLPRDARLMRLCQRGVLQFVIVKPVFAVLDIIALACGFYYYPPYQYFELSIYNVSYTWALYCMFVFYMATNHIIRNFRPVLKFASVKVIVFATYYQSLAIKAAPMPAGDAVVWNDLILCVEMVLFAIMHVLAYPTSEFQGGTPDSGFMDNVKDVLKLSDVMQDMYHNFTPVYHDYGLQRQEKEMTGSVVPSSTGILSGNLDSVAVEMSNRYRGRNRRFAFNSLLRGDKPIRARLRPFRDRGAYGALSDDDISGSESGDIEAGGAGAASPISNSSSDRSDMNSAHGLLRSRMSGDDLSGIGSVANPMGAEGEEEKDDVPKTSLASATGAASGEEVAPESSASRSAGSSRSEVLKLRTHGIGVIITAGGGVTMREANEFPTEDEQLVNAHFLNQEADRDRLSIDRTKEYRIPQSRYPQKSKKKGRLDSPFVPDEDVEGMQQEFEFGLSGLVDADYLRQEFQPFKLGDSKDGEDGFGEDENVLTKYKAAPLGAPVKLSSTFAKRKVSVPNRESTARQLARAAQRSAAASPVLSMDSDLASSLRPELLPRGVGSAPTEKKMTLSLRSRLESLEDANAESKTAPSWEPQPWETLPTYTQTPGQWDDAQGLQADDSFDEFQGYAAAPHRAASSDNDLFYDESPEKDAEDAIYNSGSSHGSASGFYSGSTPPRRRLGSSADSTPERFVPLTGSSRSQSHNNLLPRGATPPRNIVGKGRKMTNREQYDPEEDVDSTM